MRILHVLYESRDDYFGLGGVGVRAYELYKYLKDRHDITLLCKKYPGEGLSPIEGLRHLYVGTESRNLTRTLLSYACHVALFVKKHGNDFDIIVEEFSPAIPTFSHAFTKKPIILQIQGYTGGLYFRKYNPLYALALYVMERMRTMFYSNFIFLNAETAGHFMLRMKKKVGIIPNGVSPELLNTLPEEGDFILYLGRIDIYGKGLDLLVRAYEEFHGSFPDVRLALAGDGRDMAKLKLMLRQQPEEVSRNIVLLGWVSGDRKADLLRRALFVIFPSRHEVQPIAALEAMACEKALIVSDIAAFSFVTKQGAGLSFRNGSSSSLFHAMNDLMESNGRSRIGEKGRSLVRQYTWDKIAVKYEDFLTEVHHWHHDTKKRLPGTSEDR
ncbi:MAG: glycosyltransferase family 4 protein [Dissulfurispiraceae bacterium]